MDHRKGKTVTLFRSHPSIYPLTVYPSTYPSILYPPTCMNPTTHLSTYHPFIHLYIHVSNVCQHTHPSSFYLSIHLPQHSMYPSTHLLNNPCMHPSSMLPCMHPSRDHLFIYPFSDYAFVQSLPSTRKLSTLATYPPAQLPT